MVWGLKKTVLGYIYSNFILHLFLKRSMPGKTSWTCWKVKCGETASLKNFYEMIHAVHMLFLYTQDKSQKTLSKWGLLYVSS